MPAQTDRIEEQQQWAEDNDKQLPYISKSRLTQYKKCPEKFRYVYLLGIREPENFYMKRGTNIHEVIEDYYAVLTEFVETRERGPTTDEMVRMLPDHQRWHTYTEPFMANFITWEINRFKRVSSAGLPAERALPVGIEQEGWVEAPLGISDDLPDGVEEAPWMGFADAVFPGEAFGYDEGEGNVIVDFKTGKVPNEKYRDEGIYLEGEYYGMIFEEAGMDIAGVAGYYPKQGIGGTFVETESSPERRMMIRETIKEMQIEAASDPQHLEIETGPLCKWGEDSDSQCLFYDTCKSTWGEPAKHKERFLELVDNGKTAFEIADALDMNNVGAVHYWGKKMDVEISKTSNKSSGGYYAEGVN